MKHVNHQSLAEDVLVPRALMDTSMLEHGAFYGQIVTCTDPLLHWGELQHMTDELGSYKKAHTRE